MKCFRLIVLLFFLVSSLRADLPIGLEEDGNNIINFNHLEDKDVSYRPAFEEWFNKGTEALRKGQIDQSIECYKKSIANKPNAPQSHFNLGIAYETNNDIDNAIEAYKDAILQRLDYPKAHLQLAKLYQKKGLIDQAIIHFEQTCTFDKNLIEPAISVARLLVEKERYKESVPYFERAVNATPANIQLALEYANALNTLNHTQKALDLYTTLHEKRPNDTGILYNIAYTLKKLGRMGEALVYYETTLQKNPHHAEAHFSLGLAYLASGDFKKGWPEYEWRWKRNSQQMRHKFSQPQWDGSSLDGKTILLHAEQGLGDTFQFIRYAQLLKERYNTTIIVMVQRPLQTIIAHCCPYIDKMLSRDQMSAHFDVHAPLMTLPYILGTEQETVPQTIPYIIPDPALVNHWQTKLAHDHNLKVGICWQGNSKYSTPFLRAVVAAKSMQLAQLAPLGQIEHVSFYNLQKETGTDQLDDLPSSFKLELFDDTFDNEHGRFMDTAAVIKNLDLIITIDTSIAHLAGAIGVPVWVMLPEPADWRWMINRRESPWYPDTMKLFHQPTPGDWQTVIQTIGQKLEQLALDKKNKQMSTNKKESTIGALLKNELAMVTHKLQKHCSNFHYSSETPDIEQAEPNIHALYHLTQMRHHLQQKIALLEE